jgi:hypothetical protein
MHVYHNDKINGKYIHEETQFLLRLYSSVYKEKDFFFN